MFIARSGIFRVGSSGSKSCGVGFRMEVVGEGERARISWWKGAMSAITQSSAGAGVGRGQWAGGWPTSCVLMT